MSGCGLERRRQRGTRLLEPRGGEPDLGTVDLVQRGITGIEPRADILHFNPSLPDELTCLEFRMRYRRHLLSVTITPDQLKIQSHRTLAPPITIAYRGHIRHLASQDACWFSLIRGEHHLRDRNVCALT